MAYVYMIGVGVYFFIWLIFFALRQDLRKKLVIASLLAALLGFSEMLFIPEYWTPKFQTILLLKEVYLGSILFCFFLGGVTAVLYQVIFKNRLYNTPGVNPLISFIVPLFFTIYFFSPLKINIMYYAVASMLLTGILIT